MAIKLVSPGAMVIGLMGPPGSGKGTQARFLAEDFGFHHFSTGDMLRQAIREGTEVGRQAEKLINDGHMMPDDVMNRLVGDFVAEAVAKEEKILLDGYPRTLPQLFALRERLADLGTRLLGVFFLEIPIERLTDRLEGRRVCADCGRVYNIHYLPPEKPGRCDACEGELRQRADDFREAVRERLLDYERVTRPVVEELAASGELVRIHADQAHELVQRDLIARLNELAGGKRRKNGR